MNITLTMIGLYGLFVLLGGIGGYFKAKSIPSLIAGVVSGLLLFACAALVAKGQQGGRIAALVVMAALLGFFGSRFLKTRKFMPGGMNSIVTIVFFALVALCVIFKL